MDDLQSQFEEMNAQEDAPFRDMPAPATAMEAIAAAKAQAKTQEAEAIAALEVMPTIEPIGTLEDEQEYRRELRDMLDSQKAHLATSRDSLMRRATICGRIIDRLNQRIDDKGKPKKPVQTDAGQVVSIITGLIRFASVGPDETSTNLYQYDPQSGIYKERPTTLKNAISKIWPSSKRIDRAEVIDRITNALEPVQEEKRPEWIVMQNGVLDVKTKKLQPFSPDHVFLTKVAQPWIDTAKEEPAIGPDKWKLSDALAQYFDGQADEIRAFYHVCQLALLTNKPANVFIYFYSRAGQSGKGTMTELLMNLVGQSNAGPANIETIESDFGLATVYDKALIYGNENDQVFARRGNNNAKMLATGDGITINRKGLPAIAAKPTPLVVQSMNSEPKFYDLDGGIRARLRIFEFGHGFPDNGDENMDVRAKYIKDPTLLQWLTHKVLTMDIPDRMPSFKVSQDITQSLVEDSDTVGTWYDERMAQFDGTEFPTKLMYADYQAWMGGQGKAKKAESRRVFTTALKARTSDTYHYEAKHGRTHISAESLADIEQSIKSSPVLIYSKDVPFSEAFTLDSQQGTFRKL